MRAKTIFIILGALILAAGAGFFIYYQTLPEAVVVSVKRGAAVRVAPANVLVTASFVMDIKSEAGGRILASNVREGQEVKAGDVLYQIDTEDQKLEIKRFETERDSLKKSIDLGSPRRFAIEAAKEAVKNSERLAGQGRISQQDLERAKRALEEQQYQLSAEEIANQKQLALLENALEQKRRAVDKMTITVANDGTVTGDIFARRGDLIGSGQILCQVIAKERLVQAQISEENFSGVVPGLPVNLQLLGYGGQQFKATVDRVLPNADEKTKRYTAYLKVDIPEERLVPGLTGEASIMVDKHEGVLLAEQRGLLGNKVYVVRDGHATLVDVVIGFTGMAYAEILSGLNEGDEIIINNPASFRNGQRVRAARSGN